MHASTLTLAVVDCGPLESITNGNVQVIGGTTFNSIAMYNCSSGYHVVGMASRVCQSSGQWSGSTPRCDRNCEFLLIAFIIHIPISLNYSMNVIICKGHMQVLHVVSHLTNPHWSPPCSLYQFALSSSFSLWEYPKHLPKHKLECLALSWMIASLLMGASPLHVLMMAYGDLWTCLNAHSERMHQWLQWLWWRLP